MGRLMSMWAHMPRPAPGDDTSSQVRLTTCGRACGGAGCARGGAARPIRAEPLKERLANQAKAIAILESENEKLRQQLKELKSENERLRKALAAPGGAAPQAPRPKAE